MGNKSHVIYQVIYPDRRRGLKGESTALFRSQGGAQTFATNTHGRWRRLIVSAAEIKKLAAERKLD